MNKKETARKGQENVSFLAVLIIILLIMVILFFIINGLNNSLVKSFEDKSCDEAMRVYAMSPKLDGNSESEMSKIFAVGASIIAESKRSNEIPCETIFIEIKDDDEKKIKEKTASALVSTWRTFGRGNYELFSNSKDDDMNFCVIRYYLDFEGKAKEKKVSGLFSDMEKNDVKGAGENQLQYITNRVDPEAMDFNIDTNYDYAVIYVHSRNVSSIFSTAIGGGAGGVVGAGTGIGTYVVGSTMLLLTPVSLPATAIIGTGTVIGAIAGGYSGYTAKDIFAEERGAVVLIPYTEEDINKLNCDFFPGKQDIKNPR